MASAALAAAAIGVWAVRGRPPAPSLRSAARSGGHVFRDPVVAIPAAAVGAGLAYSVALAVATPANDYDTLWYHLTRAAFWRQEHAVDYIERANDLRLNVFPPGAEIVSSWAMTLSGNERFAGLFQLVALLATMLAIIGIARRLGLDRRAAAFGAILFATLPVVLLQASTPLNDIAVASFLVLVVHFVLSDTRAALPLAALALALAVATKGTALLALPLLLVFAAVLSPRRRWPLVALAGAAGIAMGAFWYVFNLAEKGSLIPRFAPSDQEHSHASAAIRIPAQVARMAIDAVDPAGSVGRDRYLYAVAAAAVLVAGAIVALRRRSPAVATAAVCGAGLVLVPLAFATAHDHLLRGYQRVMIGRDQPLLAFLASDRDPVPPSPFVSWYGPLGLLLLLATVPLAVREIRRGKLRKSALLLALAPVLYVVIVVLGIAYSPFHGRYLMPAVAFAAATWGLVLRVRPLAWAASAIATVTLVLSIVHYAEKPVGFFVLGGNAPRSVWNESRIEVLRHSQARGGAGPVNALERRAADDAVVALRIRQDDVSYPFFGADLGRRVVFIGDRGEGMSSRVDWLVVAPGLRVKACAAGWREVPTQEAGWRLYRRVGTCPGESAAS